MTLFWAFLADGADANRTDPTICNIVKVRGFAPKPLNSLICRGNGALQILTI